ncbi:hypothetical protein ACFC63_03630 [Streptomyces albidoflavus]
MRNTPDDEADDQNPGPGLNPDQDQEHDQDQGDADQPASPPPARYVRCPVLGCGRLHELPPDFT